MATSPLPETDESRYAPYIGELREFFATSGLPFGSPEDIFALAGRLRESGTFFDDLGSLIRSIVLRQGGAMAHAELLEILSLAIAGPEPAQAPEQFREPLRQLLGFVSGVMRRPWNVPPIYESAEVVPFPTDARTSEPEARVPHAVFEQIRDAQIREEQIREEQIHEEQIHESRSEPSSPLIALPVPELHPDSDPVPRTAKAAVASDPEPRRRWTPTRRNLLLGAAGAMALAAVLILALRSRQPEEVFHIGPAPTQATSAPAASSPVSAAAPAITSPVPIQPNSRQSAPRQPASPPADNSRPATSANSSPSPVSPASSFAPQSSQAPAAPTIPRTSHRDPDSSIVGDLPAGQTSSTASPRFPHFNVSSGVMAAYLVSSPDPDYPRLAHIAHVEGQVILQAVVAKDGSVSSVRVLRGNPLLRRAAEGAVRRWRYRPFRLGGQPIDVATIVTVDFHDRN